jgi:hypothetical protein
MSPSHVRVSALPVLTCLFAFAAAACGTESAPGADPAPTDELAAPQMARLPRTPLPPDLAEAAAAVPGTLGCHLEYERFSPFAALAVTSFSQPMATLGSQSVTSSDGSLLLYAAVNPNPPANLSFEVGVDRVSSGLNLSYTVLPTPALGGAWLFETGTQITPVTINGVTYNYVRAYCSLTP